MAAPLHPFLHHRLTPTLSDTFSLDQGIFHSIFEHNTEEEEKYSELHHFVEYSLKEGKVSLNDEQIVVK